MTRFIIALRKRPELDMEKYMGEYEFSVVSRSLFTSEGKLILETNKSDMMNAIRKAVLQTDDQVCKHVSVTCDTPIAWQSLMEWLL